jgi:hypothetical protein
MRKLTFLVLLLITNFISIVKAEDQTSNLIRKAYIDVLGLPPTIQEIEWYMVYNKNNSYELAVDFLIKNPKTKWNIPKNLAKLLLLSNDYKKQDKQPLLREQIIKNLFYSVGMNTDTPYTEDNYRTACLKLINNAVLCSDGDTEVIDYMTNCLMSRSTNLTEINHLMYIIKNTTKSEQDTWYDVLQEILSFPDVTNK